MKSMEKLEELYQKEMGLAEKHKKNADELKKKELDLAEKHKRNAADIKKEIELLQGNIINEKTKALKLTETEYNRFIRLLGSDKRTVMEAIGLVLGTDTQEPEEPWKGGDQDENEETGNTGGESGRTNRISGGQERTQEGTGNPD